jgi:hypothetical protein
MGMSFFVTVVKTKLEEIIMNSTMKFDYYYGIEAEQFSFYRSPRLLIQKQAEEIVVREIVCCFV